MSVWGNSFAWGTPNSQVIRSGQQVRDDWNAYDQNYQNQLAQLQWQLNNIATPEENAFNVTKAHTNSGAFDDFFKQQAAYNPTWNTKEQQDWYKGEYARDVSPTILSGGNNSSDAAYINRFKDTLGTASAYDPKQIASGITGQIDSLTSAWNKEKSVFDDYLAAEKRQNTAYQDMSGGGYQGGFLNESYTNPFGGTPGADTGTTFGSLAANPGAASGLGQSTPNGIGATGQETGFGSYQGLGAPPKQLTAGWGGPFDQWKGWQ